MFSTFLFCWPRRSTSASVMRHLRSISKSLFATCAVGERDEAQEATLLAFVKNDSQPFQLSGQAVALSDEFITMIQLSLLAQRTYPR